jgi:hypothetical protein
MKQYAEHDKVGLFHPLRGEDMYVRVFSGGYPYLNNGLLTRSSSVKPIYSYGKNYEKGDKKFALFVWTTNSNQQEVEQLFKSSLSKVTDEKIEKISSNGSFDYLD